MRWIDISDLENWASKPEAKDGLPLLISRLIRVTKRDLVSLEIPKGKSIYRGGWDGVVISSDASEFVPRGTSLWEFGTTGKFRSKAEEDFEKRTKDAKGHNIEESTFIFVTPSIWENSNEWIDEKKKHSKWRDIKVYDGNKLVEWLSIAPIQNHWLAKEIGKAPDNGIQSAEDFWDKWKTGPKYQLHPETVTVGREQESIKLRESLDFPPSVITIQALSKDEATAFAITSILQFELEYSEDILARCIIVDSESSFNMLVSNCRRLVIIARLDSSGALHHATTKGNWVIVPVGPNEEFESTSNIELRRLNRDGFIKALVNSGLTESKAVALSKESCRNLNILRRIEKFELGTPKWANPPNVRDIIPGLLLGHWDENKESDKEILSLIAGEPYDIYITKLSTWIHATDAPILQIGSKWHISSSLDIWSQLAKYITTVDLKKLKEAILRVILHITPILGLSPYEKFKKRSEGQVIEYSNELRSGIMQSLVIIAVHGDNFKLKTQYGAQAWADAIVYAILKDPSKDLWKSLDDVMQSLAEASPFKFFSGIEDSLNGKIVTISSVFEEGQSFITPTYHHTGILWALECLAWFPEYLSRATMIFAKLIDIDPGVKIQNKPANSLKEIYLPWNPQTFATTDQRLTILEVLTNKHKQTAWKLFLELLPDGRRGISNPTRKFRWRQNDYDDPPKVTHPDRFRMYSEMVSLCLSIAKFDVGMLCNLIDISNSLSVIDRIKIINHIKEHVNDIDDSEHKLWVELKNMLSHHRSYPTANWAADEKELQPYIELFDLFKPKSVVEKNKWLFQEEWPAYPEGKSYRIDEKGEKNLARRTSALKDIMDEIGIGGIINISNDFIPHVIGDTLAHLINSESELFQAFTLIKKDERLNKDFIYSLLFRTLFLKGIIWIKNLYREVMNESSDTSDLVDTLVGLPLFDDVYDFVSTTHESVQELYWQKVRTSIAKLAPDYKNRAMNKLIEAGRYGQSIEQLGFYAAEISTTLICKALKLAATAESLDSVYIDPYQIGIIFSELDKRTDLEIELMMQLELLYVEHLASYGTERKPTTLHREISTSPTSFVEFLKWVYLPEDEEQKEIERKSDFKKREIYGILGIQLLHSLETIPGTDDEGNIDYTFLENWISGVRDEASKIKRQRVADLEISRLLSHYKGKKDEFWPSDGICKIIDNINSKSIRDNFFAAVYNNRGVTFRGCFDGGDQERDLHKYFKKQAKYHSDKWPVTASILEDLASEYTIMAISEDDEAKEFDLEY